MRPAARDFGAINTMFLRVYMLLAAAISALCNFIVIGIVAAAPITQIRVAQILTITISIAAYYLLQLALLPTCQFVDAGHDSQGLGTTPTDCMYCAGGCNHISGSSGADGGPHQWWSSSH